MIIRDNKAYRNLEEQVLQNKTDIEKLYAEGITIDGFGIKVVGSVTSAAELPDVLTYQGSYGDAYAVGAQPPYEMYIYSRPFGESITNQWLNIGFFPLAGPQGPQGPQGIQGEVGPQGEQGIQGIPGFTYRIVGTVSQSSQLPTPTEQNRYNAYVVSTGGNNYLYGIIGDINLQWFNYGVWTTSYIDTIYLGNEGTSVPRTVHDARIPVATTEKLGVVKVGNGLSIDGNGILSAASGGTTSWKTTPAATDVILGITIDYATPDNGFGHIFAPKIDKYTYYLPISCCLGCATTESAGWLPSVGAFEINGYAQALCNAQGILTNTSEYPKWPFTGNTFYRDLYDAATYGTVNSIGDLTTNMSYADFPFAQKDEYNLGVQVLSVKYLVQGV